MMSDDDNTSANEHYNLVQTMAGFKAVRDEVLDELETVGCRQFVLNKTTLPPVEEILQPLIVRGDRTAGDVLARWHRQQERTARKFLARELQVFPDATIASCFAHSVCPSTTAAVTPQEDKKRDHLELAASNAQQRDAEYKAAKMAREDARATLRKLRRQLRGENVRQPELREKNVRQDKEPEQSTYLQYAAHRRPVLRAEHSDWSFADLTAIIAAEWKALKNQ